MKLVRSLEDFILKLDYMKNSDAEVYFSSDNKYKVIVSRPSANIKFISIAHNPNTCILVDEGICHKILKYLKICEAFPVNIPGVAGVRRYVKQL